MQKAVFLDRDGVINKSCGGRPPNHGGELQLFPGVPEAVSNLNKAGFLVFVVTNQGGVGLGYMTPQDLAAIHEKIRREVKKAGGEITEFRACTHRPNEGCRCRKPLPGMLTSLAAKYNVDLKRSYMIGDQKQDLAAGRAARTATILIQTEGGADSPKADYTCPNLLSASKLIQKLSQN